MKNNIEALEKTRHPLLGKENAVVEASRCINCYDAPCIHACPTSINIPQFISRIANDDLEGSAQSILESNILGYSCATVCPVEVLCEGSCVYNNLEDPPIRIGDLQKYAMAHFYEKDAQQRLDSLSNTSVTGTGGIKKQDIKVAAIGSGPASLAFAAYIVLNGGEADIFEKEQEAGGLNTYGVAPYKISYAESLKEVGLIKDLGVNIKTGVEVGKDISGADLLSNYDAVFIGNGLGKDNFVIDLESLDNVQGALPLISSLKQGDLASIQGVVRALVIGGGNTALDIAQELALGGVEKVTMAYRRSEEDMSGYAHELKLARSLGVEFLPNHSPLNSLKSEDKQNKLSAVVFATPSGEVSIGADLVVFATGQLKHPLQDIFADIKLNDNGTVAVAKDMSSNLDKVYAGGDSVNNGKEVVNAVAEGRQAAYSALKKSNKEVYWGRFSE
ncbi:MAG: FAD-dependent oxidoreductase [Candidatus Portiera sp.]|nr:FAD-dependent oxidoreductase [Portiera sp.]